MYIYTIEYYSIFNYNKRWDHAILCNTGRTWECHYAQAESEGEW